MSHTSPPMSPDLESSINERGKRVKSLNRIGKKWGKNQENISKLKKINTYTYFELKTTIFIDIQNSHVHTMQNIDRCPKFYKA